MKPSRRKLVRRSFMAAVTGAGGVAAPAGGDQDSGAAGTSSASRKEPSGAANDSDSH